MSYEIPVLDVTLSAAADLSSDQYLAVYVDTNGNASLRTTSGYVVLGVLQNKPKSGQSASVRVAGITKWIAGGTIAAGAEVAVDANGKAITAVTGNQRIGIALTGASSGDVVSVLIRPNGTL